MRIIRFLVITLLFLPSVVHAQSQESQQSIWSPTEVDWRVSRTADPKTKKDLCQIHWVYDRSINLSFNYHAGHFYFHVVYLKDKAILREQFAFGQDRTYEGLFIKRDDSLDQLGVRVVAPGKAFLHLASDPDGLEFFTGAERVTIMFPNAVMNLPLANAQENFAVFKECLATANVQLSTTEPMLEPREKRAVDAQETVSPEQAALKVRPTPPKKSLSDYENLEGLRSDKKSQKVVRNLMKKLKILELEKEGMRKKLLSLTDENFIPDLIACQPDSFDDSAIHMDEDIIVQFENIIELLRSENTALNRKLQESLARLESAGSVSQEAQVLKNQIDALKERNTQLQGQVYSYQELIEAGNSDASAE